MLRIHSSGIAVISNQKIPKCSGMPAHCGKYFAFINQCRYRRNWRNTRNTFFQMRWEQHLNEHSNDKKEILTAEGKGEEHVQSQSQSLSFECICEKINYYSTFIYLWLNANNSVKTISNTFRRHRIALFSFLPEFYKCKTAHGKVNKFNEIKFLETKKRECKRSSVHKHISLNRKRSRHTHQ